MSRGDGRTALDPSTLWALEHDGNVSLRIRLLVAAAERELGRLDLGDALALVELYAAKRDLRFERAALRWHGRLGREVANLSLEEAALALSALLVLDRLPADGTAQEALGALLRRHGLRPPRVVCA